MSPRRAPVVLIGPMAAGKSHLGQYMNAHYGMDFVDADHVIVSRHGPIPQLFTAHGEDHFRAVEADVVTELLTDPARANSVISLGGGAPMSPAVQSALAGHCVMYLEVDEATVRPRIVGNTTRPMLQPDPESRWREILESRRDTYERLATMRLDGTNHRSVQDLAHDLYTALQTLERDDTP